MSETSEEIDRAVVKLGMAERDFHRLDAMNAAAFVSSMEFTFISTPGRRWLWEVFELPWVAATFADQRAFARIERVVPDVNAVCRFVAEDDEHGFLVHECSPRVACRVIGECFGFEYYLVDPDLRWLVCENHHDTLFAVGELVIPRLRAVAADSGIAVLQSEASDV